MSKKSTRKSIIRHILEIRPKNRVFSFMDYRGEMIDFLVKEIGFENVRVSGPRIDVASKDVSLVFFFGLENFGLQIEAADSFDKFETHISQFFSAIKKFKRYDPTSFVRIGVRSSVMYQIGSTDPREIRTTFNNNFLASYTKIEKETKANVIDTGFIIDFSKGEATIKLQAGPVLKTEPVKKYFGDNDNYDASPSNGLFIDIDYSINREIKVSDTSELEKNCIEGVKSVSSFFGDFLTAIDFN